MEERLGFIGLGVMGQAMARHLADEYPLAVWNRTPERMAPLIEEGCRGAASASQVVQASDIVFLMLSNDGAVSAVVEGPEGLLEALRPGQVVVDHSTISPAETRRMADLVSSRGAEWIDAPVTGGDIGAREATLTIMAGGTSNTYQRVLPYLQKMGRRILHVGPVGQGQTLKLTANLVSGLTLMAASEGVRMGLELGLAVEDLATVMNYGSAQSYELKKVLDRWNAQDFNPGFSVENRYKDLKLALDLARQRGFDATLAEAAEPLYRQHLEQGFGAVDEASYIQRWTKGE